MSKENKKTANEASATEGNVIQIGFCNLEKFQKHVFKPKSDEELGRLSDSIKENGLIQPIIVRSAKNAGRYEIICGHSRVEAAKQAGLKEIDAIVREMSDDEAIVLAIETNIAQRSFKNWLHSERTKSIYQYHEIIKNPGKRTDLERRLTAGGNHPRSESSRSRRKTALAYGESEFTIKLYLALNKLTDGLMGRLDAGEFGTSAAYEFSLVNNTCQMLLDEILSEYEPDKRNAITVVVAKELREMLSAYSAGDLGEDDKDAIKIKIRKILTADEGATESKEKKADIMTIKLPTGQYKHFFSDTSEDEAIKMTIAALEHYIEWNSKQGNGEKAD